MCGEARMTLFRGGIDPKKMAGGRWDAGFSLCSALLVMFVASGLMVGWAQFERTRRQVIEKKSSRFYAELDSSTAHIKSEWENRGEIDFETW